MAIDERAAREVETQLAQHYLDTAALGREVSNLALQQALRDAKAGNLRDPAKTAVSAITASAIALDKRLILQERPTQIISNGDPKADGQALLRALGITIEAQAHEIPQSALPEPTPQPLLPEAEPAKPRARVRKPRPKPSAD